MSTTSQDMRLLLQVAEEDGSLRGPLPQGLELAAATEAPRPTDLVPVPPPLRRKGDSLGDLTGDPNDLEQQGWAVIYPEGGSDAVRTALNDLVADRAKVAGEGFHTWTVPCGLDSEGSLKWIVDNYTSLPLAKRPRYVLLTEDVTGISLDFQQALASVAYVGRLAFEAPADYGVYARKVLDIEAATTRKTPRALFCSAWSALDAATRIGRDMLVEPCYQSAAVANMKARPMLADVPTWVGQSPDSACLDPLLSAAATPDPAVLLSLSHGIAYPRGPFENRKRRQGTLSLGDGDLLGSDLLAEASFLPGGVWLMVACYGAGTPDRSAYARWLRDLAVAKKVDELLPVEVLPKAGDPPFVAELPKVALANPKGPLAVIGHMDLAWTYSFQEEDSAMRSRADRFWSAMYALLRGRRVGPAFDTLLYPLRETNERLLATYEQREDDRGTGTAEDAAAFAGRWMLRQDLRGYVTLGDPAARMQAGGS